VSRASYEAPSLKTAPEVVQTVVAPPPPELAPTTVAPAPLPQIPPAPPASPSVAATLPGRPEFNHAPDYTCLTGELEYIRARNVWRLRYAPPDQEDRHGGTVLLVGDNLPPDCKSGQIVRVQGQLVNPNSEEARPPYWVQSFQVLKAAPPSEE
jgi:hypothetical protein